MKIQKLLLGLCTAGILHGAAFQNGSFESPALTGLNPDFVSVPTGWTITGDAALNNTYLQLDGDFNIPYVVANGHESLGFGGNGTTGAAVSQIFDTVIGTGYVVTWQYLVQQGSSAQALQVDVTDAGAVNLATDQFSFTNNSAWAESTLSFTATTASTTLKFTDTTTLANTGGANWALDAVTVDSTAPEPSTAALAAFAVLGVGFGVRRFRAV